MPTTYNRILTGGVTDWVNTHWDGALDKHQTLAGSFKEAHANYRAAQDFLNYNSSKKRPKIVKSTISPPYYLQTLLRHSG